MRGTIVAVQRHHARGKRELPWKIENVTNRRGAERVNRLRVITHDGETLAIRFHGQKNRCLQAIGVLILVYKNVVETRANLSPEAGVGHHLRPVQQQVVVIEHTLRLLFADVSIEEFPQFGFPVRAPREYVAEHVSERCSAIHDARVDGKTS